MPISILETAIAVGGAIVLSFLLFHFIKWRWSPLLVLAVFWGTGILVGPVLNGTFIQVADLTDFTELHHDQVVAVLGVLGILGAVWAELRVRRALREKEPVVQP